MCYTFKYFHVEVNFWKQNNALMHMWNNLMRCFKYFSSAWVINKIRRASFCWIEERDWTCHASTRDWKIIFPSVWLRKRVFEVRLDVLNFLPNDLKKNIHDYHNNFKGCDLDIMFKSEIQIRGFGNGYKHFFVFPSFSLSLNEITIICGYFRGMGGGDQHQWYFRK